MRTDATGADCQEPTTSVLTDEQTYAPFKNSTEINKGLIINRKRYMLRTNELNENKEGGGGNISFCMVPCPYIASTNYSLIAVSSKLSRYNIFECQVLLI